MNVDSTQTRRDWPLFHFGDMHIDERGSFRELFSQTVLKNVSGRILSLAQINSIIGVRNSIRGFHALEDDWKVLACIEGEIQEAFLDLRKDSKDYGKSYNMKISQTDGILVILPPRIAHAFQVTSKTATIIYASTVEYSQRREIDINPFSTELSKFWSFPFILSERDTKSANLSDYIEKY